MFTEVPLRARPLKNLESSSLLRLLVLAFFLALALTALACKSPKYPDATQPVVLEARKWEGLPIWKVCHTSPWTVDEVRWAVSLLHTHGAPDVDVVASYCDEHLLGGVAFPGNVYIAGRPEGEVWPSGESGTVLAVTFLPAMSVIDHGIIHSEVGTLEVLVHESLHVWLSSPNHPDGGHVDRAPHVLNVNVLNFGWGEEAWAGVDAAFANSQWAEKPKTKARRK